jgi:hypothetical protein
VARQIGILWAGDYAMACGNVCLSSNRSILNGWMD